MKKSRKEELFERSEVLKEGSFTSKMIRDEETFNKAFKIENNETLKVDKAMLLFKIRHDMKKRAEKSQRSNNSHGEPETI